MSNGSDPMAAICVIFCEFNCLRADGGSHENAPDYENFMPQQDWTCWIKLLRDCG